MRLRRKPWVDEAIREFDAFVFARDNPPHLPTTDATKNGIKGRWREIFPTPGPLWLEIGVGKGDFILGMAQKFPQINFVGLEAAQDVLYTAAQKIAAAELVNVRLAVFDANKIHDLFAPGEISRLYLNFSDPWPKKRHAKRRLTHRDFLAKYRTILAQDAKICFKTDNLALFDFSLEEFAASGMELEFLSRDLHAENDKENVMTEYEKKFSSRGNKIYLAEAFWPQKIPRPNGEGENES